MASCTNIDFSLSFYILWKSKVLLWKLVSTFIWKEEILILFFVKFNATVRMQGIIVVTMNDGYVGTAAGRLWISKWNKTGWA